MYTSCMFIYAVAIISTSQREK